MTEVPRQPEQAEPFILRSEGAERGPRSVGRAVVDEDDLVRAERSEHRGEPSAELVDGLALVVDGYDDGEHLQNLERNGVGEQDVCG